MAVGGWRTLRHFPPAPDHAYAAPDLGRLPALRVCWAELGGQSVSGQAGTAGLTHTGRWDVTVSGLLIRHPQGDVLLDAGNSSRFREELTDYGLLSRMILTMGPGSNQIYAQPADALRRLGADPAKLRFVALSHAHIDHAGGLVDLPGVPVLLSPVEAAFVERVGGSPNLQVVPAHARAMAGRTTPIAFVKRPYAIFDESADLFGDGSVVFVPLPGHTPGSVGTFVNLSPKRRVFHVGDVVNLREGYERRVGKSLAMSWTDHDAAAVGVSVAQLARLHERDPDLLILPAHDRSAWVELFGAQSGRCTP